MLKRRVTWSSRYPVFQLRRVKIVTHFNTVISVDVKSLYVTNPKQVQVRARTVLKQKTLIGVVVQLLYELKQEGC